MVSCEMCGAEGGIVVALIEGVELNVCKKCVSFGKVLKKPLVRRKKEISVKAPEREIVQMIKEDYAQIIRDKREKLGLKQKEFAKFLNEKESLIHKIESGTYAPSIELARKMEKQLGISLVEQKEIEPQKTETRSTEFTIGDALQLK